MKFFRTSEIPRVKFTAPLFTGPDLSRQALPLESKELRMGIVNFGKSTRNKFHAHSVDQVLIVTAGRGFVVTETETKEAKAGDIIYIPAGEKHWHGAGDESEFSHITVTVANEAGHKTAILE